LGDASTTVSQEIVPVIEKDKLRKSVLIAEDDPVSRTILNTFLARWGYEVTVVTDGSEALRVLEGNPSPRLAVLDWMMPELEGIQVCQRIRGNRDRPYIYILLLTARSEKQDMLRGLELGADDYLTKPFDAAELRARIRVGERILNLQDDLISAREELRFRATHDGLTGVPNRATVMEALNREASRQLREGSPFGILIADIDHFKNINDSYGHLCGDDVLKAVVERMKASIRPYDVLGRYGGEEFLIVAPGIDAKGAMALAERIRRLVEAQPVGMPTGDVGVTVSVGVAVSGDPKPIDARELLSLADEALYQAKNSGRNRSELAGSVESRLANPHTNPTLTSSS
jgi:two-component system, cell cycle response regulator